MGNNSITIEEKISSHYRYWKRFFQDQNRFRKTFSNYFQIIPKLLKTDYPIITQINNANEIEIQTYNAAYFISQISKYNKIKYDIKKDTVLVSSKEGKEIKFFGGINNGDIIHSFLDSDYRNLDFQDKYVLDVGMNIGDSSIFFILNGASQVIGIEPFSKNFELACKNINENNFQNKIQVIHASCSSKTEKIKINEDEGVESVIEKSNTGLEIESITIEDMIKRFNIPMNSILKMDCEGCENEVFSSISKNIIRHFSQIQIEYHNGYKEIKNKLEGFGYDVKITKPISSNILGNIISKLTNQNNSRKIGYVGFILAKKREKDDD